MKRWKFIRRTLASVGYTTIDSVRDVVVDAIDEYNYVYYTDQNGDYVKATYNSTIPIVVDSETEVITFTTNVWLGGLSAWTYTYAVTNENGLDVTSEVAFNSRNLLVVNTGGTNGRVLSAIGTGTTTVSLYHSDWDGVANATASGTSNVIVSQINTNLFASGGSMDTGGTGAFTVRTGVTYNLSGLTLKNQFNAAVNSTTAKLYFYEQGMSIDEHSVFPTGVNWIASGTTSITIYDYNAKAYNAAYTGVSYAITITN